MMSDQTKVNTQALGMPKDALPRVSLEGSEVVRRQFMSHIKEIILTVRPDGIQFNNSCVQKMEGCDYINILINRQKRWLIVRPCGQDDRDAQRWCNNKDGVRRGRKLTGRDFCTRLYRMMGWNKGYYYKICGTPALREDDEGEVLLVFELEEYERYTLTAKARRSAGVTDEDLGEQLESIKAADAEREATSSAECGEKPKTPRRKAKYPDSWQEDAFGTPIEEHVQRIRIDVLDEAVSMRDFTGLDEPKVADSPPIGAEQLRIGGAP